MPPDAFTFDTSGQLVMQTAIGGARHAVRPAGRRRGLAVPAGLPAGDARARRGLEAGARRGVRAAGVLPAAGHHRRHQRPVRVCDRRAAGRRRAAPRKRRRPRRAGAASRRWRRAARGATARPGPILQATRPDQALRRPGRQRATSTSPCSRASCAASSARTAPARSTFFKMLTCEVPPTSGKIVFEGRDITGMSVTDVCQLGLTKSYQVNQLFNRLTVRENLTIAALADAARQVPARPAAQPRQRSRASTSRSSTRSRWSTSPARADTPVSRARLRREAPAGDRPRARHRRRACCCSTSRSPA